MNRQQSGRLGAHSIHARGLTNAAPARAAFDRKFELEGDPDGTLPPDELRRRVKHAKSDHYARLSARRWGNKR